MLVKYSPMQLLTMMAAITIRVSCGFTPTRLSTSFTHGRMFASVTGTIYDSLEDGAPTIRLFTKEGCTLCDKVKDTLETLREELPHSLEAVDITDAQHRMWYDKYKYDIPVLHVGDQFWIKHRITEEDARVGLNEARSGSFVKRSGEPDAGALERRQAERLDEK